MSRSTRYASPVSGFSTISPGDSSSSRRAGACRDRLAVLVVRVHGLPVIDRKRILWQLRAAGLIAADTRAVSHRRGLSSASARRLGSNRERAGAPVDG